MAARRESVDSSQDPANGERTSLEMRYAKAHSQLNQSRRQLIRAMLDSPEETFFLSSRAMAKRYDVDAATIVRTIQALGYDRFADFAADLRRHFVARVTPYAVMKAAAREKRSLADHVRHSVERDTENLSVLRSSLDPARVLELAKLMHRSRRILIVGIDLAAPLAAFLAYGLTPLGFDADAPVGSSGNLQHKVRVLTPKDLLIAMSFGRCLRETVESVVRANDRGVPTFGITDSDTTPIALTADSYLIASISSPSITGSYAAPMALMNAILVACALTKPKRSLAFLRQTEAEYSSGARWYEEPGRRPNAHTSDPAAGNSNNGAKRAQRKRTQPDS